MEFVRAVGLMSGTSFDGVDVALLETDGERIASFGPTSYRPYTPAERNVLRQALRDASVLTNRHARPGVLERAEALVTAAHAEVVEAFLREHDLTREAIGVVGFHGQTVLHRPEIRLTVQLGNGSALAERLSIPVAYDFRAADVAAGGQGAPLVPVFHRALAQNLSCPLPLAVLNIGGVANVTYIDGTGNLLACDTGPGNALLDDFILARTGAPCDRGGEMAARGTVDETLIRHVLKGVFFSRPCPKSLDRNDFTVDVSGKSTPDGAATLTALTAAAVAHVIGHFPQPPRSWIVAGGGAQNSTLMRMLAEHLAPANVERADAIGWSGDGLEAQAFAFLAVRTLRDLPITFPGTTGAPRPMTGGVLASPERRTLEAV